MPLGSTRVYICFPCRKTGKSQRLRRNSGRHIPHCPSCGNVMVRNPESSNTPSPNGKTWDRFEDAIVERTNMHLAIRDEAPPYLIAFCQSPCAPARLQIKS